MHEAEEFAQYIFDSRSLQLRKDFTCRTKDKDPLIKSFTVVAVRHFRWNHFALSGNKYHEIDLFLFIL